MKSEGAYRLYF